MKYNAFILLWPKTYQPRKPVHYKKRKSSTATPDDNFCCEGCSLLVTWNVMPIMHGLLWFFEKVTSLSSSPSIRKRGIKGKVLERPCRHHQRQRWGIRRRNCERVNEMMWMAKSTTLSTKSSGIVDYYFYCRCINRNPLISYGWWCRQFQAE